MKNSSKHAAITSNCLKPPCHILHNLLTAVPLIHMVFLLNSNSSLNITIPRNHHNRITGITLLVHQHLKNHSIHLKAAHSHFISSLPPNNNRRLANKDLSSIRLLNRLQVKMIFMLHHHKGQILQGVWEGDHRQCMVQCQEPEVVAVVEEEEEEEVEEEVVVVVVA